MTLQGLKAPKNGWQAVLQGWKILIRNASIPGICVMLNVSKARWRRSGVIYCLSRYTIMDRRLALGRAIENAVEALYQLK